MGTPDKAPFALGVTEAVLASELATGACEGLHPDRERPGLVAGRCGGLEVVLTLATLDDPQRWRPALGLYRLDRGLGLGVVATTVRRELSLRELGQAASDGAVVERLAVKADGRVRRTLVSSSLSPSSIGLSHCSNRRAPADSLRFLRIRAQALRTSPGTTPSFANETATRNNPFSTSQRPRDRLLFQTDDSPSRIRIRLTARTAMIRRAPDRRCEGRL